MKILQKDELKPLFLELTNKQNLSTEEAIDKLYEKFNSNDYFFMEFNGIYVYMGTYKKVHESAHSWYPVKSVLVTENDPTAEYKLFYELDTGLPKKVDINNALKYFEENNTIIYIPNARDYEREYTFEADFQKLRKIYLKALCINNEKYAVALVTSEDYIKEVFSVRNYMKERNINPVFYQAFYDIALCNSKNNSKAIVLKKTK